jgi:zinc transporter ZupT
MSASDAALSRAQAMTAELFSSDNGRALAWSTLAGGATILGGLLAVIKRPEAGLLAFLLGTAIGVMATLSVLELFIQNAVDNGAVPVALCAAAGGATYVLLEPLLPHFEAPPGAPLKPGVSRAADGAARAASGAGGGGEVGVGKGSGSEALVAPQAGRVTRRSEAAAAAGAAQQQQVQGSPPSTSLAPDASDLSPEAEARRHNLLRLGFLMAVTMTLHNLPEGFAVAFASLTDFGPVMALAVAVHNVPEGLIVAAPIYAATGSRRTALLTALVSGLSEPVGAAIALAFIKPFLTPLRLQLMLAYVGGIMTAVCYLELLPEGRKCGKDGQLVRGALVGGVLMAATLLYV